MTRPDPRHAPVMLREAVEGLAVHAGGRYVDATVGLGGHASATIAAAQPGGRLLGIDRDPQALAIASERLAPFGDAVLLVRGGFEEIATVCEAHGFAPVDGILFDLGVSSLQLDQAGRGFSFQRDEPLDMRMDPDDEITAADIVNEYEERRLAALIYEYGEEPRSRRIARAIVARRPIETTGQLASAIEQAVGRPGAGGRRRTLHPATLTFQALRIAVNRELEQLDTALAAAHGLLAGAGARLVVISFHSLEDRRVKEFFRLHSRDCICPPRQPVCTCDHRATLREITRKPLRPSDAETGQNPRARSARLRVAESIVDRVAA
ncbi:MAG: 16S rRNA (cytosine(1402)-N(4))-methyltransferase RsmH [Chloroflexi bacterium]|nr:16S rRNA (cytosine(1402)-N(4))-methyltransferase RsmH [Chloroflexota bacterium]MQC25628.1 16S rRNA (cytosine(1402)-N(4))-methyltransferase RsmH [Chloroflexota bacterium]